MTGSRHRVVVVGGGFGGINVTRALAGADVQDLDVAGRVVSAVALDGRQLALPHDTLVIASGAADAYFGHQEWAEFAPGIKTLEDARRVRSHILGAFEMAELATTQAEQAEYLTFVVIGAGPTGLSWWASWPS